MLQTDVAITVNGLEKSYKTLKVLDKIHFTVSKGTVFALLGPNGAGKTTTMRILATLLKPDGGNAQINGFDVVRQPEQVRKEISLTGQYAAVDDVLTGRENMRMIGQLRHISDVNKKADELLDRFQLLDAADRRVAAYSGGMHRRLDLAMSLIGNSPVLFLDEPTTGLDPQSRITMWKMIKDLAHSGITVLLTTQHLEEADQLADQIAILNKGKIVAQGTTTELKKLSSRAHIELGFHNEPDVRLALDVLNGTARYLSHVSMNEEKQTLTIVTDGSIKQMTDILNRLENVGVSVAQFSQMLPTLEDVFLAITDENQEKAGI